MEAEQLKVKFKQQQLQQEDIQPYVEEEDQEEFIARPRYYSLSITNQIKQRSPPLKTKKQMVPKKPSSLKSKSKQVISDGCGKSASCKKKRTRTEDLYDNDEAKFSVMERTEEVLAHVAHGFPSFVKCMLPSNVTHGFWLILPKEFCNLHLPMHDTTVILVDEFGKEYEANYLVERHGLSAGWRGFSLAHRLLKGDHLVFHLIKPRTLKVNIVRVYGLDEVDAALCLVNLVACAKRTYGDKNIRTQKKAKCLKPLHIPQKNIKKNGSAILYSNHGLVADKSETNSDSFGFEVLEGFEISDHQANKSSCSRIPVLHVHDHLLEGINCRFTAGKVS